MALKIPRLPSSFKIINSDGSPTSTFQIWWQNVANQIETSVNGISAALEAAGIALDAAAAAQAAADVAQAAADSADAATTAAQRETSLVNSYVDNFTAPLITADSTGGITIANHDRVYGDPTLNPTVAVVGGFLATGATTGNVVRIYYDNPTRAGGAVTYQFSIDPTPPPVQSGDRHSVGAATIPVAGSADGNYLKPPGFVDAPI